MIAADHDRRADLASRDEIVDPLAELRALPVAQPANPRRQALKRHTLRCEADPARERAVLGKELEDEPIGSSDVGRVTRERDPTEGTASFGEQRADVRGDEARVAEGIRESGRLGFAAQVVPVVERDRSALGDRPDRLSVARDRPARAADAVLRVVSPLLAW